MYSLTVDALTKLAKQLCPPGNIQAHAGLVAPEGFLHCNGQAISRIDYPELYSVIGTMYGDGDGSTTFNIPDYRGYFLRGWNNTAREDNTDDSTPFIDPDAESREARPDGTNGNNIGTVQGFEVQEHRHQIAAYRENNSFETFGSSEFLSTPWDRNKSNKNSTLTGGNETRPKNISVMYIIKT